MNSKQIPCKNHETFFTSQYTGLRLYWGNLPADNNYETWTKKKKNYIKVLNTEQKQIYSYRQSML